MMDKVINWALVGVSFLIAGLISMQVAAMGGTDAAKHSMSIFVITGFMMSGMTCEGDSLIDRLMGCMVPMIEKALWYAFAVVVYVIIVQLMNAGFNIDVVWKAAVFTAVSTLASALVFSTVKNATR